MSKILTLLSVLVLLFLPVISDYKFLPCTIYYLHVNQLELYGTLFIFCCCFIFFLLFPPMPYFELRVRSDLETRLIKMRCNIEAVGKPWESVVKIQSGKCFLRRLHSQNKAAVNCLDLPFYRMKSMIIVRAT